MTAKTIVLTSFAAAMMLTTAATAAPVDTTVGNIGKPVTKTSRIDSPDQRYCIVNEVTGSRIPHRACKTLAGWQEQGIDPRQLPRR